MTNPMQEFLESVATEEEKVAFGFGSAAKQVRRGVVGGMGASVAAGAVAGVGMAANNIYLAATKAHDFKTMLAHNPDLQEHHERDPRTFNQMFSSLRMMNPTFSSDPIVAGTYMRRMVENPMTAGGILTESVGMRDKFPSVISRATDAGVSASSQKPPMRPSMGHSDPSLGGAPHGGFTGGQGPQGP